MDLFGLPFLAPHGSAPASEDGLHSSTLLLLGPLLRTRCLLNGVPHSSVAPSIFLIAFSLCYLGHTTGIQLSSSSLTPSSAGSDLLWGLSHELVIVVTTLATRDFSWLFLASLPSPMVCVL